MAVPSAAQRGGTDEPLRFWTKHENPTLVDLTVFSDGDDSHATGGRFIGGFTGRPELIQELAPALRNLMEYLAPRTVNQYQQGLRYWWRNFDFVELGASGGANPTLVRVQSVAHITELHRQHAFDTNMDRNAFGTFLTLVNVVRRSQGLRRLLWEKPEARDPIRHLPPEWQIREVRLALKHGWFAALDRWDQADELIAGRAPTTEEESRLARNYGLFAQVVKRTGHPRPPGPVLWGDNSPQTFGNRGFSAPDMFRGRYPDAEDIRYAFHLCLAATGWNPSVLLTLDASKPFIEPHPKDASRYLLHGYKARSKTEQLSEGLYKSQGSPGVILQTLMRRTELLRTQLRKQLREQTVIYETLLLKRVPSSALDEHQKLLLKLRTGVSSLWLYVTPSIDEIVWLDPNDASYSRGINQPDRKSTFLDGVVNGLNAHRTADSQLARLTAGDFRDALAAYAYRVSGGMILYVMKVLGHKNLSSTQKYLDNSLINDQSARLYQTFSNALWTEIKVFGRMDPTIIALCSRDGQAKPEQRARLVDYRNLKRSRIGVLCKNPTNPPRRIAPDFRANGKAMCHVQRCMLCLEHAVVFPDSLPGIAKRFAELEAIQREMSMTAFIESSFDEELVNTRIVLTGFNTAEVDLHVSDWSQRIRDGRHRLIDHDGIQRMTA